MQIYRKGGNWKKARAFCEKLIAKYPDTIEAEDAREIIENNEFYFTIQVGSFADRTNAQKLCDNLSTKGYDSYIQEFKGEIAQFYRVRVGRIGKKHDADMLEAKLKSESLPTKIIP